MNEKEKKALKVIKARTRRLLDELEIEKEDMSDELKIAYLMQEIRANKTILNLIEKLQKENEELKNFKKQVTEIESTNFIKYKNYISKQKVKDKIEEIDKIYNDIPEDEGNFAKAILIKEKQILQELLEGRK